MQAQTDFTFPEVSPNRQSTLEQHVAPLRGKLAAVVPTPSVDSQLRLASSREELKVNALIGKSRAAVQMGRENLNYNRRRVSDQYSHVVHERLKAESSRCRRVLVWVRCIGDVESKIPAVAEAETQTIKRSTGLAIRLAGKDTWHSRITDVRGCVVASMDGFVIDVEAIVVRIGNMMDKLRLSFFLIQGGPRAACEELFNLVAADFMPASIDTSAAPGAGSAPASEAVSIRGTMIIDY